MKIKKYLEVRVEGDVAGPLDGGEEEAGGQFADVVDAHDVVGRLHALAVARRRVRLGAQQQRNVRRQVAVAVEAVDAAAGADAQAVGAGAQRPQLRREAGVLRRRHPSPLHGCAPPATTTTARRNHRLTRETPSLSLSLSLSLYRLHYIVTLTY